MTEYKITKEQCEKNIGDLVCSHCGIKLTAIRTVDNSNDPTYWAGCEGCSRFNPGTTREVFELAEKLVDTGGFCLKRWTTSWEAKEKDVRQDNIHNACEFVCDVLKILNEKESKRT